MVLLARRLPEIKVSPLLGLQVSLLMCQAVVACRVNRQPRCPRNVRRFSMLPPGRK